MKQNAKSAIFTCENGKRLLRQLLLLLPAWIVLALGIAMCVFSGVGSDTNTSFQQGLGRMLGLQTGTVTLIFNCTVLAIFIFANRSLVGLGSLVIGFGLGPLLNLYLDLLGKIFPTMPPMWALHRPLHPRCCDFLHRARLVCTARRRCAAHGHAHPDRGKAHP